MKETFELRVIPERGARFALEVVELDPDRQESLFGEPAAHLLGRLDAAAVDRALDTVRAWLRDMGLRSSVLSAKRKEPIPLDDDRAMRLTLLFGALGPLEREDRIEAICDGIARMTREEAMYWHGKTRNGGRARALQALRILLAGEMRRPSSAKEDL